jgi:hypothetical protein
LFRYPAASAFDLRDGLDGGISDPGGLAPPSPPGDTRRRCRSRGLDLCRFGLSPRDVRRARVSQRGGESQSQGPDQGPRPGRSLPLHPQSHVPRPLASECGICLATNALWPLLLLPVVLLILRRKVIDREERYLEGPALALSRLPCAPRQKTQPPAMRRVARRPERATMPRGGSE